MGRPQAVIWVIVSSRMPAELTITYYGNETAITRMIMLDDINACCVSYYVAGIQPRK